MAAKLKAKAKPRTAKAKSVPVLVPECLAFALCHERKVDCRICLDLSPEGWREHALKVLGRG